MTDRDSRTCECGHEWDEHLDRGSRPCAVDGCACVAYEAAEPEDDPEGRAALGEGAAQKEGK